MCRYHRLTLRLRFLFLACFLLIGFVPWVAGQSMRLVKDIHPGGATDGRMELRHVFPLGNRFLLSGKSDPDGYNPWLVDVGTQTSEMLVAHSAPAQSLYGANFAEWRGRYYFLGTIPHDNGIDLWQTDLTAAGTVPAALLPVGAFHPRLLVGTDSALVSFWGLFYLDRLIITRSDGTQNGTWRVDSLGAKLDSTQVRVIGNTVAFVAGGSFHLTDGSPGVQRVDLWPGGDEDVRDLLVFDGRFWFSANDSVHGRELWVSDGTVNGTQLWEDYRPGPGHGIAGPGRMATTGAHLYWASDDGGTVYGPEIRLTDGTVQGTRMLEQVPGAAGVATSSYAAAGNRVYFKSLNKMLFVDSLGIDTIPFLTFSNYPAVPSTFAIGDTLLVAYDRTVYRIDGTQPGSYALTTPSLSPTAVYLQGRGDTAYFALRQGKLSELYQTNGRLDGTRQVSPFANRPGSSAPVLVDRASQGVVFIAESPGYGGELWGTDGTLAGTEMLINLAPGTDSVTLAASVTWNGDLYLMLDMPTNEHRLVRTDGSHAGTQLLWSGYDYYPMELYVDAASGVYFPGKNGNGVEGIWHTNGSLSGTTFWTNAPGNNRHRVLGATAAWILFGETDLNRDTRVWACDRTAANLHQVAQHAGVFLRTGASLNGQVVYVTSDNDFSGNLCQLHATNGDSASTLLLSMGLYVNDFPVFQDTAAGRIAVSFTRLGVGVEIWSTDGTVTGTEMMAGTAPNQPQPSGLIVQSDADYFYFMGQDPAGDANLYQSDGTTASLTNLGRVCTGPFYFTPQRGMWVGPRLHGLTDCDGEGLELWAADLVTGSMNLRPYWPGPRHGAWGLHGSSERGVLLSGDAYPAGRHPVLYNLGQFTALPDPMPGPEGFVIHGSMAWENGFVLSAEGNEWGHELFFVDSLPSVLLQEPEPRPQTKDAHGMVVFPVPAQDRVYLRAQDARDRIVNYELLDLAGRSLTARSTRGLSGPSSMEPIAIDLSGYPAGIYLLRVQVANSVETLRFVKQ